MDVPGGQNLWLVQIQASTTVIVATANVSLVIISETHAFLQGRRYDGICRQLLCICVRGGAYGRVHPPYGRSCFALAR